MKYFDRDILFYLHLEKTKTFKTILKMEKKMYVTHYYI